MATTSRTPPVPRGKHVATVTPAQGFNSSGANQRMMVEKDIVDELLLVCGVIGSTTKDPANDDKLVPVTDCLNWLQDLQRALRRDDDSYRPISLLIGKWKVVQQKLLPLVISCRYDTPMVLTIVKILVILTKPLSDNAKRAGRMVIDTKNRKVPESVIKEQIKLRENAVAQSEMLMEYKRVFAHHSSHMPSHKGKEKGQGGLLSVFVSLLAEPLSKTGTSRTDTDHLTIELVLHLFRNLLSAEPLLKGSSEASNRSAALHQEIVVLFERQLVLDIVLVIAQEMELRENAQYNLLMMELLHHLLRNQDPTAVARSIKRHRTTKGSLGKENAPTGMSDGNPSSGSLRAQLSREKQRLTGIATSRHSHFGGTLVMKRHGGKRQYRSAALGGKQTDLPAAKKRKNRKTEPFIGAGKTLALHTRSTMSTGDDSLSALRAQRSLHNFCTRFVKDCYGPVMKSLKNEFRRDSQRLEEGDKVVFFRIVWFFCQWWRVSGAGRETKQQVLGNDGAETVADPRNALGQMIFTMDVFTFNLVLNATDTFQLQKKHTELAQTVALYSEMTHMLLAMYRSSDSTENIMAMGLLDRLFYGHESLDRLPKLLSKWTAGTSTREYLCDLVELCHVSLKLLETNAQACQDISQGSNKEADADKKKRDAVSRMRETASEFEVSSYISRKIVSNHLVFMYTHLLSQYAINATHVNHRLVAFLLRLRKMKIAVSEDPDDDHETDPTQNLLATKTVTLEPMLYNIQMFAVLNQILNDASSRKDKDFTSLLSFASTVMSDFASAADRNPLLLVECLFRHPLPHRFCELSANIYVNEELRMIAERELLLDERRRLQDDYDNGEAGSQSGGSPMHGTSGNTERSGEASRQSDWTPGEEETEWVDFEDKVSDNKSAEASQDCDDSSDDDADNQKQSEPISSDGEEVRKKSRRSVRMKRPELNEESSGAEAGSQPGPTHGNDDASPAPSVSENQPQNNEKDETEGETLSSKAKTTKHRIRRVAHDTVSDDDDDDIFDNDIEQESSSGSLSPKKSKRFIFDDDDD